MTEKKHKFQSYDGTPLEGTFTETQDSANSVALLVHGITSSRDEFGLFSGLADHLGKRGLPSFRFDYRCHGASKGPMQAMTLAGIVNDIEAAASAALAMSGVSGIHVIGMSFGGGLSAFWAATTIKTISSVIMLAPVIDYEEDIVGQHGLLSNGTLHKKAQQALQKHGYIETDGIRYGCALLNELRYISGIEGIRRLKCESLILHGDADSIVPYASSQKFVKLNPQCSLVNIPGTDHGFGVGDDDDLSSPATKQKHREVFQIISTFIERLPVTV
jgi:pimeloyl-ACP methyl ester carboxylesterase